MSPVVPGRLRLLCALAAALVLSACALLQNPDGLPLGISSAEVLQRVGTPTARYPAAEGPVAERWQYSRQPWGRQVYNLDFDANEQLLSAEQVLSEGLFAQRIRVDHWTRQDVLYEYGPPAEVVGVASFKGEIWKWRYENGRFWRWLFIDLDPEGVVRGFSLGDEPVDAPERP